MLIYNVGFLLCLCSYLSKNSLAPHKKQKGEGLCVFTIANTTISNRDLVNEKCAGFLPAHVILYFSEGAYLMGKGSYKMHTQGAAEVCLYQTKKFIEFKR